MQKRGRQSEAGSCQRAQEKERYGGWEHWPLQKGREKEEIVDRMKGNFIHY